MIFAGRAQAQRLVLALSVRCDAMQSSARTELLIPDKSFRSFARDPRGVAVNGKERVAERSRAVKNGRQPRRMTKCVVVWFRRIAWKTNPGNEFKTQRHGQYAVA